MAETTKLPIAAPQFGLTEGGVVLFKGQPMTPSETASTLNGLYALNAMLITNRNLRRKHRRLLRKTLVGLVEPLARSRETLKACWGSRLTESPNERRGVLYQTHDVADQRLVALLNLLAEYKVGRRPS